MKELYVGGLPRQATEAELEAWFQQAGIHLDSINIIRDRVTGELRGFGFVGVADDEQAARAIASCNGQEFLGRNLVVNEARPRQERRPAQGNRRRRY